MRRKFKKLAQSDDFYFFVKEAKAIRNIPDFVWCYRGCYGTWEIKRSISEVYYKNGSEKTKGRVVGQRHEINKVIKAGGIGEFVYPENFDEAFKRLLKSPLPRTSNKRK